MSSPRVDAVNPLLRQPEAAPPNFDRVARVYRWAEYVALGPLLRRTRELYLPEIAAARHALVLGDGDGRFTAELLSHAPEVAVRAVDTSAEMLRLLQQRCERRGMASRLTVEQGSALVTEVGREVDLIVTHFFLDCLAQPEVEHLAARIAAEVKPGCAWVLSEFGLPRRPPGRALAAGYIRLLYFAFRVLTGLRPQRLPDPQRALRRAGFTLRQRNDRMGGFLYSELWQLDPQKEYNRDNAPGSGATSACAPTST